MIKEETLVETTTENVLNAAPVVEDDYFDPFESDASVGVEVEGELDLSDSFCSACEG